MYGCTQPIHVLVLTVPTTIASHQNCQSIKPSSTSLALLPQITSKTNIPVLDNMLWLTGSTESPFSYCIFCPWAVWSSTPHSTSNTKIHGINSKKNSSLDLLIYKMIVKLFKIISSHLSQKKYLLSCHTKNDQSHRLQRGYSLYTCLPSIYHFKIVYNCI
jgi:hypothetical protein